MVGASSERGDPSFHFATFRMTARWEVTPYPCLSSRGARFLGDEGYPRTWEIPINHKCQLHQIDKFRNADGLLPNCFLKAREK